MKKIYFLVMGLTAFITYGYLKVQANAPESVINGIQQIGLEVPPSSADNDLPEVFDADDIVETEDIIIEEVEDSRLHYIETDMVFVHDAGLPINQTDSTEIYTLAWDFEKFTSGAEMEGYTSHVNNYVDFDMYYTEDALVGTFDVIPKDLKDGWVTNDVHVGFFNVVTGEAYSFSSSDGEIMGYSYIISKGQVDGGYCYSIVLTGERLNEVAFFVYGDDMHLGNAPERAGSADDNYGYKSDVRDFVSGEDIIDISYFVQAVG